MSEAVARRAVPGDAEEIIRLRVVMLSSVDGVAVAPGEWSDRAVLSLRERLAGSRPRIAAWVVDRPGEPGLLAACAVGVIELRLPTPSNPAGESGYVFNVSTDEQHRRRGCSTACMTGLLGWFRDEGVTRIRLHASVEGHPLYRRLGFRDDESPAMRIVL